MATRYATTQQQFFQQAFSGGVIEMTKATVFATYRPALSQYSSEMKIPKRAFVIDEISLDDIDTKKKKPRLAIVKKAKKRSATKKSKTIPQTKKPTKKTIRAKRVTEPKTKKTITATVLPVKKLKKEEKSSNSFTNWLQSKAKSAKSPSLTTKIRRSTKANNALITEPIAEQLVKQGHIMRGIEMYEQLRLIIPEKSSYFAALISKLKKEI